MSVDSLWYIIRNPDVKSIDFGRVEDVQGISHNWQKRESIAVRIGQKKSSDRTDRSFVLWRLNIPRIRDEPWTVLFFEEFLSNILNDFRVID